MSNDHPETAALQKAILGLEDGPAVRLLENVVKPHFDTSHPPLDWSPELAASLGEHFDLPTSNEPPSRGELARQSLLLLALDPQYAGPIMALISGPTVRAFDGGIVSGPLLIIGALFALQSHIQISNETGRWVVNFEKKPTQDKLLTPLITKLVSLITGGPPVGG